MAILDGEPQIARMMTVHSRISRMPAGFMQG